MANQVKKQAEKAKADTSKQAVEATSNDQANSVQAANAATQVASLASTEQAADAAGNDKTITDEQTETATAAQGADLASADQATATLVANSESAESTQATALAPTEPAAPVKALKVTAKVDKFRRGGIVFDRTETTVHLADLTDEQIKQIKDEPLLSVTEVEVEAE